MKLKKPPLIRDKDEFDKVALSVQSLLSSKGVSVTKEQLNDALAPSLFNQKSFEDMISAMKSQPKSAGGLVFQKILNKKDSPEKKRVETHLFDTLHGLIHELDFLFDYNKTIPTLCNSMSGAWSLCHVELSEDKEFNDAYNGLMKAIEDQQFELMHFVKPYSNNENAFDLEMQFSSNQIAITGEIQNGGKVDLDSVFINGVSYGTGLGERSNNSSVIFSQFAYWLEDMFDHHGFLECSNKFTTKLSVDFMRSLIDEANEQAIDTVINRKTGSMDSLQLLQRLEDNFKGEKFSYKFNINGAVVSHEAQVIDSRYSPELIVKLLSENRLSTSVSHDNSESMYIFDHNNLKIAVITKQSISSFVDYTSFELNH